MQRHSGDSKLYLYLIAILINVPKINLLSLGSFDQGIRVEDFIVVFFGLKVFFQPKFLPSYAEKDFSHLGIYWIFFIIGSYFV